MIGTQATKGDGSPHITDQYLEFELMKIESSGWVLKTLVCECSATWESIDYDLPSNSMVYIDL